MRLLVTVLVLGIAILRAQVSPLHLKDKEFVLEPLEKRGVRSEVKVTPCFEATCADAAMETSTAANSKYRIIGPPRL